MPVFFNGRLLVTPQSASLLDDSAMFNKNISVGNVAALIGRFDGLEPFKAHRFGGANEALAIVQDEIARKAIEKAFDPSAETTGPSTLVLIPVAPATQAALTLKDAGATDAIVLNATMYGRRGNQIKVKVENASVAGKKLTTQLGNDYFSADNVARNAFNLRYTGAEASGAVTISGTQLVLKAGGAAVDTIELVDFPTVQELVDRINAVAGFTANVADGNGAAATLNALDFVADADIKTALYIVTAHLQACIDWFNGATEGFINATRAASAGAVPANVAFTYLAGASDGVVTNAEWQKAFDALQNEDVQWITPLSDSASVHAMADTHVSYMSNVSKKKRRNISGMGNGVTDAQAKDAAKALNSDRTSLVHLGIYDYDAKGKLKLYPAYVTAALLAGMFSGVNPGTALTNKTIKARGLERKLRNPTDTDQLILGGVLCVEDTDEGYKVVQSISTWLTNDNYNRVEQSVGAACDFVLRNVQEAIDGVRGKKGNPRTMQEALSRAETRLQELARPEPMGPGVLVGDEANPPYRKLSVSLDGDVMRVEYECSPVIPVNYVLQVAHAVPYSGSASA